MRRRILRRTVVVPLVLLLSLLGPGGAAASPLTGASAYGYGAYLSVAGSDLLTPTPEASAGPGPDESEELLDVPLTPVAFSGTAGAKAKTSRESTLGSELGTEYLQVVSGGPALPSSYNAQAYARTEGAAVLVEGVVPAEVSALLPDVESILTADVIHSEALVACENGAATIVGGGQVIGLELLGSPLTDPLDDTLNQVVDLGDNVLATLLNAQLVVNEVIPTDDGVRVNALRLTIPGLAEVIVAHTEVTGASCEPIDQPECSDGVDNDGDGKIDFGPDPGCSSPDDDDERDLVRTGGNGPGLGLALFGAGGLLMFAAAAGRKRLLFDSKS